MSKSKKFAPGYRNLRPSIGIPLLTYNVTEHFLHNRYREVCVQVEWSCPESLAHRIAHAPEMGYGGRQEPDVWCELVKEWRAAIKAGHTTLFDIDYCVRETLRKQAFAFSATEGDPQTHGDFDFDGHWYSQKLRPGYGTGHFAGHAALKPLWRRLAKLIDPLKDWSDRERGWQDANLDRVLENCSPDALVAALDSIGGVSVERYEAGITTRSVRVERLSALPRLTAIQHPANAA